MSFRGIFSDVNSKLYAAPLNAQELLAPVTLAAMEGDNLRQQTGKQGLPSSQAGLQQDQPQAGLMSYQEASDLATWVLEIAYLIRRSVYERIKWVHIPMPCTRTRTHAYHAAAVCMSASSGCT